MAAINWTDELSVKISSIDEQHKKLIHLINDFYDNIRVKSPREKISELITELKKYTVLHFSTEEKYFKQYNYPGYLKHKSEHEQFIKKVLDFEERYKNGRLLLSVEITNFIKEWVSEHIQDTDKEYSAFLIQKGVK